MIELPRAIGETVIDQEGNRYACGGWNGEDEIYLYSSELPYPYKKIWPYDERNLLWME